MVAARRRCRPHRGPKTSLARRKRNLWKTYPCASQPALAANVPNVLASPCGSCPRLSACASARPGRPLGSPRTFLPWHRPNAGSGLTQTPGSARATAPAGTRSSAPGAGAACRRSTFLLRGPDRKGENQEGYGDHGAHGATSSALTSASA